MMKKGHFITFKGAEGSGKSAQIRKTVEFMQMKSVETGKDRLSLEEINAGIEKCVERVFVEM